MHDDINRSAHEKYTETLRNSHALEKCVIPIAQAHMSMNFIDNINDGHFHQPITAVTINLGGLANQSVFHRRQRLSNGSKYIRR